MASIGAPMGGLWMRYAHLAYAIETNPPRPERLSVAKALTRSPRGMVTSFSTPDAALSSGRVFVEPSPKMLEFVAHMYRLPAGYLTGADDNELRDTALDRACVEKVMRGVSIPDSFFIDSPCQGPRDIPSPAERSTVAHRMRKLIRRAVGVSLARSAFIALITSGFILLAIAGATQWPLWVMAGIGACATAPIAVRDLRTARRGFKLLRLPKDKFQITMESRIRQEIGANLHDLITSATIPVQWLHNTLCHRRPLSIKNLEFISAPYLGHDRIIHTAIKNQLRHMEKRLKKH